MWKYLSTEYKTRPFDAFLDTTGTQELFQHCPAYLKDDGLFINIGAFGGAFKTALNALYNWYWPRLLGGVPRKYILHSTIPNLQVGVELMELIKEKKLKVVIEKVYPMEDALEVKSSIRWYYPC